MKTTNKVIKECIICGNEFEDKTRPKNKKTCSRKCGDEARKARQREEYRKENPPKPNQRQLYYYDHYEYAFWLDQDIGRNQMWKEAVPYDPNKIESISIAREMEEYHGGRKSRQEAMSYDGDEKGSRGVNVRFVESNREPSEVTSYKMTPAELKEYLASKKSR